MLLAIVCSQIRRFLEMRFLGEAVKCLLPAGLQALAWKYFSTSLRYIRFVYIHKPSNQPEISFISPVKKRTPTTIFPSLLFCVNSKKYMGCCPFLTALTY